jgi:thiol-disulfide isomerase/thioredoxin
MYLIVNSNRDLNKLQKAKQSSNVLVWYYADWCGHCQMMKDEWEKLVNSNPHVDLAKVSDKYVSPNDNIAGYPTLKLFTKNKTAAGKGVNNVIDYQGSRDAESLKQFVKENVKPRRQKNKPKKKSRRPAKSRNSKVKRTRKNSKN